MTDKKRGTPLSKLVVIDKLEVGPTRIEPKESSLPTRFTQVSRPKVLTSFTRSKIRSSKIGMFPRKISGL